ncbi:protein meaA [Pseudaquidulcibacter saccharophilus]|uniref:protein meaA n=1 Tax=Pseudaquidulcibacter saccharophilus TaxID=2831900 RepID=UPI001EFF0657|nr:protein meaA [Pseudaquidulcibacter saccharophilus]
MEYQHAKDRPWIFRTYAGHSTAKKSNELYRANLARGQTGLSVAFDLPTQTALDSDHVLSKGEVGKVGVPICHIGDMRTLFDGIDLGVMNTSMTINAPAAWLLSLYVALADEQGVPRDKLQGTTQNDIIKEYLSRGTYVFPPEPSLKLTVDTIEWCLANSPKFNAMNVCSYHLQEAGATPEQELAFALATAIAILDEVKSRNLNSDDFDKIVRRISFFVNAGMRFITETCKMRAFTKLWDELCETRYGVKNPEDRRFRYGVQVNSLGLTEPQPENNVYRILLEALAVTMSKDARARAVQLPAWNEALGLPRPFDQQWSLRMQQILAYETDLLEFEDIFNGSTVIEAKTKELIDGAKAELAKIEAMGGAIKAVSYMKEQLVNANRDRLLGIEGTEQIVVGVNKWTESEESPLGAGTKAIQTADPMAEQDQVARLNEWRKNRDEARVAQSLAALKDAVQNGINIMEPSIECAKAGVTTGEWGQALREVLGEYRGPTGVSLIVQIDDEDIAAVKTRVEKLSDKIGEKLAMLVGKPGLDGHSNGSEQIATRARAVGFETTYEGIRSTPEEIVNLAKANKVHIVGLSILSGSHLDLVRDVVGRMREAGLQDIPVVVGGIIPPEDEQALLQFGVRKIYTPKDFKITEIMGDIVGILEQKFA